MPRYTNARGVEINTSEEVAGRLGLKPAKGEPEPRRQQETGVYGDRKPLDEDEPG